MRSGARRLRVVLLGVVVVACAGSGAASTAEAETANVVISTAPGDVEEFEPAESSVVASGTVALTFRNASSQPHNLVFTDGVKAATRTIVEAGGQDRVVFVPPGPGTYPFACTIHDGMQGSLEIEAPASR